MIVSTCLVVTAVPSRGESAPCMELSAETVFLCVDVTYNASGGSIPRHDAIVMHWGDGTETWLDLSPGRYPHTYAAPGTYTITMQPITGCGAGSALSIYVEVDDAPDLPLVVVSQGASQVRVLTTEPPITSVPLRSTVDWGDGSPVEEFEWAGCGENAFCTPPHYYVDSGEYEVRVRIEYIGAIEQPCYERETAVVASIGPSTPVRRSTWGAIKALYQ